MRPFALLLSVILPALALLPPQPAAANDWPHWRGPNRNGISTETGWTDQWPAAGPTIAWNAQVGLGFSSFAVAAGRVITLGHALDTDTIFAFDAASGRSLWKHSYPAQLGDKYFDGGTTGSPTLDGDRVFTLSRWGDLFCLAADDGHVVWSKNIQKETRARVPDWGFTGSPLVLGDRLILNVGEAGVALDKKTGAIVWQSAPKTAGYSTPLPARHGDTDLLLFGSGAAYVAVNPRDGKEAWRITWVTEYGVNASDPILDGDRLFVSTGYGKGAGLFKIGQGQPEQVWKSKALRTQLNGAILSKGHLYGVDGDTGEKASLKCLELATGQEKWAHPRFGSGGIILVDGRLVALSGTGELMIAPASPDGFNPVSRAQVLGGKCWTAPVLSGGRVLCRNSRGEIACVDLRKQ